MGVYSAKQITLKAVILFVDKKDSKLRMCIDYHALNKITIKNNYPLPCIYDLLDSLNGVKYFNWIDLKSKVLSNRNAYEDVEKMAMKIRYDLYKFLVMPFKLCNTPSTSTTLMNSIFHDKLNKFMIIYINDILVYFKTREEHVEQLEYVLNKLR